MRIFKKILLVIAVFVLVVSAIGFIFFPSHIHVERKTKINRNQTMVYNYVSDFHNWNNWSPWFKLDTTAKYSFEGPASGVGAKFIWDSNVKDVGKGSMLIIEAKPDSLIRQDLSFMGRGGAKSSFRISSNESGTDFIWGFDMEAGANPLMRIMGSYMDGMIGKDFESGLLMLKDNLEAMSIPNADSTKVGGN